LHLIIPGRSVNNSELYVGIMSGTSLDGIDTALIDFSNSSVIPLATHYQAYPETLKQTLLALHQPAHNELHQTQLVSNELAHRYADAVNKLLQTANITPLQVRAIGCHGQTIRHRPEDGYSVQLVNAALLAELSGITVVSDFRSRDIAAGGQGAPLVPAFHHKILRHPDIHRVIVNIGGISNLTDIPPGRATSGFDCGPGNLLMDAWIMQHTGKPYDINGEWATSGTAIPELFQSFIAEPYLHTTPPKSCGRDLFNLRWLKQHLQGNEAAADVQATLLAMSVYAIGNAILKHCRGAQEVYLCGGGAHNTALINQLKRELPGCQVLLTDQLGIEADWLEAIAFAWLAQQTLQGQCANLPQATGARHPCILGAIHQA